MAKRGHSNGGGGGGGHSGGGELRWLLTYSDLITLLVAFFIVMFAGSRADLEKFQAVSVSLKRAFSPGVFDQQGTGAGILSSGGTGGSLIVPFTELPPQQQDFLRISEALENFAQQNELGQQIGVNSTNEGIVISMSGMLLFNSGSTELRAEAIKSLDTVSALIRPLPNKIRVEGHTDTVPPANPAFASNWDLSTSRAVSVLRYLIVEGHIPANRLAVAGYGEFKPVANNDTRQGRALNRRVDIAIIYASLEEANRLADQTPTTTPTRR